MLRDVPRSKQDRQRFLADLGAEKEIWRRGDPRALFFAGVLCGAAVALKLTNAPFAAGLLVAAMVTRVGPMAWLRSLLSVGAGLAAGFEAGGSP